MQKSKRVDTYSFLGMNITSTCRCTVKGEVPHHFWVLNKSFLCVTVSVFASWERCMQTSKRVESYPSHLFGHWLWISSLLASVQVSYTSVMTFALIFAWYRSHCSFSEEELCKSTQCRYRGYDSITILTYRVFFFNVKENCRHVGIQEDSNFCKHLRQSWEMEDVLTVSSNKCWIGQNAFYLGYSIMITWWKTYLSG